MKIGRHEYKIVEGDAFLDNGNSVQLLTQSKEKSTWGNTPNPVLSKRAIKELHSMEYDTNPYGKTGCSLYVIKANS